jgi:ATP-dependent DNA helicase RecG
MALKNPCDMLERLIDEGRERPWLEFKQNNADPTQIGGYISALSNSALLQGVERAFIVFGIEDGTLRKVGTAFKPRLSKVGNESLENWLTRKLDPQVNTMFHEFECRGLAFVVVEIEPSYFKPVKFNGEAYIRIGEHKKKLADHPEYERSLWLATGKRKFESAVAYANATQAEVLSLLNWQKYYELVKQSPPENPIEIIKTFIHSKFLSDELDNTFAITNLGALLWAKDITVFPSVVRKTVRVNRYLGVDAKNAQKEVEGTMGYALGFDGLIDFVSTRAPQREKIFSGIRRSVPFIPEIAIREVIANALIHQDLTADGSGPIIEIYDNRIEISNPGQPLGEINRIIDDAPRSRNELLARTMRFLGLCEERGKGIDKTIMAIEDVAIEDRIHLPAPSFRVAQNGFTVTLYGPKPFSEMSREEKQRSCYQHCVLRYLRNDFMNNSSLRERFSLAKDDYQSASAIITDAVRSGIITPADDMQGKRNARYVPSWARQ